MNCCSDKNYNPEKQENKNGKHRGHMSHMLMMLLCCGAPIILLSLLPLLSSKIPSAAGIIAAISPFICPIMMLMMVPMMFRSHKDTE